MLGIDEVDHLLYIFLMSTMERESMKVRELTDARIIYNVCDLAFLREQKEYEITGNPAKLKSAELSKEMELSMI